MKYRINPRTFNLQRRTFLRSTTFGVTTVAALPLLEAMFKTDHAYAQAPLETPRFFGMYVPNGISKGSWWPSSASKTGWSLMGTSNEAFEKHDLLGDISLYKNMNNACQNEKSTGNNHLTGISSWLTGHGIQPHDGLRDSDMATKHRLSMEQEVSDFANSLLMPNAEKLPNPDLMALRMAGNSELDKGRMDYNNAQKNGLNWGKDQKLLPLKSDIAAQFDALYSKGVMPPSNGMGGQGSNLNRRQQMKLSVLDDIRDERLNLLKRLGAADKLRMELYFSALEDIESSIEMLKENQMTAKPRDCAKPMDAATVQKGANPNGQRAAGIGDHTKVAAKLFPHAMSCGLIHTASYCAGGEAAGCTYSDIGVNKHFHNNVSHGNNASAQWKAIDKWHSDHAALMVKELKDIKVGDGTMLDNTAFMYGSGLGDGSRHQATQIAMLVAGNIGNWKHGNQHVLNGQNHAKVVDTIRRELGMKTIGKGEVPID